MVNVYELNILSDILKNFKVNNIVITGLSDEKLLKEILGYNTSIIAIDPNNQSDMGIDTIQDISLNILPNLNNYDAIFINDDPNWYTVFNQLNIIKNTNDEFPLVFICHNHFPHQRRDSYINPDLIPDDFKNDFSKELPIFHNGEKIQIKDNFYHATVENTSKNGVLTAIEDFLEINPNISMMNIHFIEGITILYPKSSISQIRISKIEEDIKYKNIENIDLSSPITQNQILLSYISKSDIPLENIKELNNLKAEVDEQHEIINDFENKIRGYDNEINYKDSRIEGIESKLNLKDSQIKNIESKLENKDVEIGKLNHEIDSLKKIEETVQNKFNDEISIINTAFDNLENQIDDLIKTNENTSKKLNDEKKTVNTLKTQHAHLHSKIDSQDYCICCFKEEISNNKAEIEYLKNEKIIKNILSPLSYFILWKSNPKEASLNMKLYKALKDSKCFDTGYYLKNNRDIMKSNWCKYFSPELHYVCKGFYENRKFNKKYYNRNSKKELLDYLITCGDA